MGIGRLSRSGQSINFGDWAALGAPLKGLKIGLLAEFFEGLEERNVALIEAALPPEDREQGLTRHDLDEIPLAAVLDDARSMSLFAAKRVIWISGAEAALPRGRAKSDDDAEDG